ncbi:MAG: hypothetical protein ACK4S4_15835 [Pyrinomonadaceae bacterium]
MNETVITEETNTTADTAAPAGYVVDGRSRSVQVEYTDRKLIVEHQFVKAEDRELIQYYLAAPSIKANAKGRVEILGQPSAPAAKLHDQACSGVRILSLTGELKKELTLEAVRELRQSIKADGVLSYIGGYYDVELGTESGDMDDLLFDRDVQLTATVKTRPTASGKVDKTFKIFLNRPDDLSFDRFVNHSSTTSLIDKSDAMLAEFLGDENLAALTGGEDEGERVAFSKTTQHVRQFLDVVRRNIVGAEGIVFEGAAYNPSRNAAMVNALDPVLLIQIGAALRNFS